MIAILDNFHFDLRNSTGVEMSNFYKKTKFGGRQRRNFAAGNKGRKDKNLKGQFTERSKEEKNKQMDESDDVSKEDEATGEENMEDDAMEVDDIEETTPEDIAKKEFTDDGKLICKPALATRIHRNILKGILPKLHKCLTKKVCYIFTCVLKSICLTLSAQRPSLDVRNCPIYCCQILTSKIGLRT